MEMQKSIFSDKLRLILISVTILSILHTIESNTNKTFHEKNTKNILNSEIKNITQKPSQFELEILKTKFDELLNFKNLFENKKCKFYFIKFYSQ